MPVATVASSQRELLPWEKAWRSLEREAVPGWVSSPPRGQEWKEVLSSGQRGWAARTSSLELDGAAGQLGEEPRAGWGQTGKQQGAGRLCWLVTEEFRSSKKGRDRGLPWWRSG